MIIVAVKLLSILMNFIGKIVLQVGCSDNYLANIQYIYSSFLH